MNEEEKEAIKLLNQEPDFSLSYYKRERAIEIVLNLISKLQKELDKKDKVIDKMAEDRAEIGEPKVHKETVKYYYYKEVEKEK